MVQTRETRKRRVISNSVDEDEVDLFLQEEDDRVRIAKQHKTVAAAKKKATTPLLDLLPRGVIENIFLYLSSARDVYHLAFCAKFLRDAVTAEIVIRAAVFQGGVVREVITTIMDSVANKKIHTPSTLRLLRLVNAKRCERGDRCLDYHLETKQTGKVDKKGTRPFAMSMCKLCVQATSINTKKHHMTIRSHNRVEMYEWSRVLTQSQTEVLSGDPVGPIILATPLLQICGTYKDSSQCSDKLKELFQQAETAISAEAEAQSLNLLELFEIADGEYDAFVEAKEAIAAGKQQAYIAGRNEKARAVYAKLGALLEDYEHKDFALECTWSNHGVCTFKLQRVQHLAGVLVRCPSRATKSKLIATATSIRSDIDLLYANGFIQGDSRYLRFLLADTTRSMRALYDYCVGANDPFISTSVCMHSDGAFFGLLRDGKCIDALLRILNSHHVRLAFTRKVVKERGQERTLHSKLASNVFRDVFEPSLFYSRLINEAEYRLKFVQARTLYQRCKATIKQYISRPQTIAFLAETGPPPNHRNAEHTRRDAVNLMYEKTQDLRFLKRRDFASLLNLHRSYFYNQPSHRRW